MAGKAAVPKFGSWDAENIGYTVFFEKVRENKTAPVPATAAAAPNDYDFDPYEHYENLSRKAASRPPSSQGGRGHPAPPPPQPQQHYYEDPGSRNAPSRPPSSQGYGHPAPPAQYYPGQHGSGGYHRRNGSNGSSAASEVSSRASKFSPPRPYQPRYSSNSGGGGGGYHQPQPQQQYAAPEQRHYQQHAPPAPRVAASPPRHAPPPANERRPVPHKAPSAVPKFGVWDEQNAAAAAQGFTRQFEQVKRHREVAKVAAPDVPSLPRQLSPDRTAPTWGRPPRKAKKSFLSKVYRCLFPVVRQ